VFLIARRNSIAIGCGAIRRIEDEPITFELKRMFTTRAARGIGLGRKLLAALEAEARARGGQRLVLETGELQAEAVRLYERAGFTRIPKFGEYVDAPLSLCMGKTLD
jgi:GNAT superfamily N-acetyltransferase